MNSGSNGVRLRRGARARRAGRRALAAGLVRRFHLARRQRCAGAVPRLESAGNCASWQFWLQHRSVADPPDVPGTVGRCRRAGGAPAPAQAFPQGTPHASCSASCAVRPRRCPTASSCSIRRAKSSGSTARRASCSTCRAAPICGLRIDNLVRHPDFVQLPARRRIRAATDRAPRFADRAAPRVPAHLVWRGPAPAAWCATSRARCALEADAQGFRRQCLARAAFAADGGRRISGDLGAGRRPIRRARGTDRRKCGVRPIA